MRRFDVRWVPLMIAAGAFVGSALVSSVAVANEELSPIDESALVVEPAAATPVPAIPSSTDPSSTDPSHTDEGDIGTIDISQRDDDVVSGEAPAPPFEDIGVVQMVVPDVETMVVMAAPDVEVAEGDSTDPALADAVDGAATPAASPSAPASGGSPMAEAPDEGHEGGSGGKGNPYRMTFTVIWLDTNGTPIDAIGWRTLFELSAFSETGKRVTTSATCTYPAGSDVLECVFDNPSHGPGGLVVPARSTAVYTVTVTWPLPGWTIDGANAGPYSARDLCPRGGGEGGEEGSSGHETGGGEAGSGRGVDCEHTVVMRQSATVIVTPPVPPVVEPEVEPLPPAVAPTPPTAPTPPVVEPEVEALPPVVAPPASNPTDPATAVAPAATAPRSLPATGGSVSLILLIAALVVAIGSVTAVLARRTS